MMNLNKSYNIKEISGLTPLNCLTPKLCYEDIRATPLIFVDKSILDRSLKNFLKENKQTNERGVGPKTLAKTINQLGPKRGVSPAILVDKITDDITKGA